MPAGVSDEAFARVLHGMGGATFEEIEAARQARDEAAQKGVPLPLAEVLIQQGIITPAIRDNVERKLRVAQAGGLRQLGPYKLIKKLGEGGMGAVYLAEDLNVGRKVAVKTLLRKYSDDREFLARFRREAQATGKLNHVNIVMAYTVGEEMGDHYYVMEYCDGETLDRVLKREQCLPWDRAVEAVMQVARGLKHAHEHGIIHRDIKPANIFVCKPLGSTGVSPVPAEKTGETPVLQEGFVAKILDLGLSKNVSGTEQSFLTQAGMALGTPHYISPEQARGGRSIDGRADIYSLGATFYHLVTGQTPFQGSTPAAVMMKHLTEQLPDPQDIRDGVPDGVAQVIRKMMAKEPDDRYNNCKELLSDLELVIDGKMPSSKAVDVGKSSVAMRVRTIAQPAGLRAQSRGLRHETGGMQPRLPAERRGRRPPAPAQPSGRRTLYLACGIVALGLLVSAVALIPASKPGMGTKDRAGAETKRSTAEQAAGAPKPPTPEATPAGQAKVEVKTAPQPGAAPKPAVQPAGQPAVRPWRAVFDGRTLGCLRLKGDGAWRVENGALANVPDNTNAAVTEEEFGDGDIRIRFEVAGGEWLAFRVRLASAGSFGAVWSGTPRVAGLAGKQHELLFHCCGDDVAASLDGQPLKLVVQGRSRRGAAQLCGSGRLRVLSIEHRELPARPAEVRQPPDPKP